MKSFVLWLATAAAIGATAGTILRPGIPEIFVAWVATVAIYYAWFARRAKLPVESPDV